MQSRKSVRLIAVAVSVLGLVFATVASDAQTTSNTYTGCLRAGQISNVKIGTSPTSPCVRSAVEISWSEQGPPGADGTSVTTTALDVGDSNCPNGGVRIDSASQPAYVCNGANGQDGAPGPPGAPTLDGLDGTECTFAGFPATTDVSTDPDTGKVAITCGRDVPDDMVRVTVSGGLLESVTISSPLIEPMTCRDTASCSVTLQFVAFVTVDLSHSEDFWFKCGTSSWQVGPRSGRCFTQFESHGYEVLVSIGSTRPS
jgi:hypothetical protein